MPQPDAQQLQSARILVDRLARLSADSPWAHRASGLRAALDRMLAQIDAGEPVEQRPFERLLSQGYAILIRAAEEIPAPEEMRSPENQAPSSPR